MTKIHTAKPYRSTVPTPECEYKQEIHKSQQYKTNNNNNDIYNTTN